MQLPLRSTETALPADSFSRVALCGVDHHCLRMFSWLASLSQDTNFLPIRKGMLGQESFDRLSRKSDALS